MWPQTFCRHNGAAHLRVCEAALLERGRTGRQAQRRAVGRHGAEQLARVALRRAGGRGRRRGWAGERRHCAAFGLTATFLTWCCRRGAVRCAGGPLAVGVPGAEERKKEMVKYGEIPSALLLELPGRARRRQTRSAHPDWQGQQAALRAWYGGRAASRGSSSAASADTRGGGEPCSSSRRTAQHSSACAAARRVDSGISGSTGAKGGEPGGSAGAMGRRGSMSAS